MSVKDSQDREIDRSLSFVDEEKRVSDEGRTVIEKDCGLRQDVRVALRLPGNLSPLFSSVSGMPTSHENIERQDRGKQS